MTTLKVSAGKFIVKVNNKTESFTSMIDALLHIRKEGK